MATGQCQTCTFYASEEHIAVQICYPLDYEALSSELIRQLRGPRSQAALSRRLRYRSNVVRSWEAGRRFPTAARFFWLLERLGKHPNQALGHFYAAPPIWLAGLDLTTSAGVAQLLRDLRGKTKLADIATRAHCSRFSVSRWLAGESEPRLPDLLRVVEAISLRGLDFVACFADPRTLPSAARRFDELETARRVAVELPWSHAVLRSLELQQYRCLPQHEPGFIAAKLGIELEEEQRCLALLSRSGQISKRRGLWRVKRVLTVDTQGAGKRLLAWWAQVGAERLKAGRNGRFSYNLFTVSGPDLQRLRDLQLAYFRELRSIVAQSEPAEHVVVTNLQLFALDE